jgi:hypothetical protein
LTRLFRQAKPGGSAAPTTPPAPAATGALAGFDADINGFKAAELTDALITVFGEVSPNVHPELAREARAIASTIFNRFARIAPAAAAAEAAEAKEDEAEAKWREAVREYETFTKARAANERTHGKEGFQARTAELKRVEREANKAYVAASGERIAANSTLRAYLSASPGAKTAADVTLSTLVADVGQYEGYPTGKRLLQQFASMSAADQARNRRRWDTAKEAVRTLATDAGSRDKYIRFLPRRIPKRRGGGERVLQPGETRIGDTDFTEKDEEMKFERAKKK